MTFNNDNRKIIGLITCLITFDTEEDSFHGTGVIINNNGKIYILTAKHCLFEQADDTGILWYNNIKINYMYDFETKKCLVTKGVDEEIKMKVIIPEDNLLDIAIVPLPREWFDEFNLPQINFIDSSCISENFEYSAFCGFRERKFDIRKAEYIWDNELSVDIVNEPEGNSVKSIYGGFSGGGFFVQIKEKLYLTGITFETKDDTHRIWLNRLGEYSKLLKDNGHEELIFKSNLIQYKHKKQRKIKPEIHIGFIIGTQRILKNIVGNECSISNLYDNRKGAGWQILTSENQRTVSDMTHELLQDDYKMDFFFTSNDKDLINLNKEQFIKDFEKISKSACKKNQPCILVFDNMSVNDNDFMYLKDKINQASNPNNLMKIIVLTNGFKCSKKCKRNNCTLYEEKNSLVDPKDKLILIDDKQKYSECFNKLLVELFSMIQNRGKLANSITNNNRIIQYSEKIESVYSMVDYTDKENKKLM